MKKHNCLIDIDINIDNWFCFKKFTKHKYKYRKTNEVHNNSSCNLEKLRNQFNEIKCVTITIDEK